MKSRLTYSVFKTGAGWIAALASARGLLRVSLPRPTDQQALEQIDHRRNDAVPDDLRFADLAARLQSYFNGGRPAFPDRLDLSGGTPFQQAVWQATRQIPYGQTRSYRDLAEQVGHPRAARAVGQAIGRNPTAILIPCHRVIGSDGRLCGFGRGLEALDLKRYLLDLETTLADPSAPLSPPHR